MKRPVTSRKSRTDWKRVDALKDAPSLLKGVYPRIAPSNKLKRTDDRPIRYLWVMEKFKKKTVS